MFPVSVKRLVALCGVFLLCAGWVEAITYGIPALNWTPRSDWINVKEHGALGDGKADDTVALQSVLSTVKSGMVIYFPPGTYRITRMLTMTGPALGNGPARAWPGYRAAMGWRGGWQAVA